MTDPRRPGSSGGGRSNEEEYFARREAELLRQHRDAMQKTAAETERQRHVMKCPKCGFGLYTATGHGLAIVQCPNCLGIWLDANETEAVLKGTAEERAPVREALLSIVQPAGPRPSPAWEAYAAERAADLARQQEAERQQPALATERATHHMKCPQCGFDLLTTSLHDIEIDQCPSCHGVWFDAGEAELMLKRSEAERGMFRSALLAIVKAVSGPRAKPK